MKKIIPLIILLLALVTIGFYFRDSLFKIYNDVGENFQSLQKTDLGKVIDQIKRDVFAPTPLNVGGEANQVVLTKGKIVAETNRQRFDNGMLPPLVENSKLSAAALAKANDMFESQYFDHISPSGVGPGDLVKNHGYEYIVAGENLILGNFKDEKEVVQLWMDSPGHRANILNERFTEIGVAIVKGTYKGQTVWIGVQEFGLPLSTCEGPSKSLKDQIDDNQIKLDQLSLQINQKKSEIESTNRRSPEYNQRVNEYNQLVEEYNVLVKATKNLISQYNNQVNSFNACVEGT